MKKLFKNKYLQYILGAGAACCAGTPQAQTAEPPYPVKPVRFVVGQAPGGGTDLVARAITAKLSETLGQAMIVDNRTGAAGSVGAGLVAKSTPDGYTLLIVSSGFAIYPSLYTNLSFDPLRDLAPVILLAQAPFLLVVHPSLPARSVKELIALAKAQPGALNFASGGTGSSGHLAGELFKSAAAISIAHVPYKGAGPALTDTIAGQVQLTFASVLSSLQHVRSTRLRALAVSSSKRSTALPNLPTVMEAGVRDYATSSWYGVLAPVGTRTSVIQRMNGALAKVIALPEMRQKLAADGAEPAGGSADAFQQHIATEIAKWARVVKAAGIRLE